MSTTQTVVINGRHYDARTGLPVDPNTITAPVSPVVPTPTPRTTSRTSVTSHAIHAKTQRSQTLARKHTKKPTVVRPATTQSVSGIAPRKKTAIDITAPKSQAISKFAPHPAAITPRKTPVRSMDIGPVAHPHVTKAHAKSAAKTAQQPVAVAPARTAAPVAAKKEQLLADAIAKTSTKKQSTKKKFFSKRHPRALSIVSATFALVLMAGYLTYLNMPSLSVRVAAAQAGIDANYPQYRPDGYSLRGPVAYNQGEVAMTFGANGGAKDFTIKQAKSGWDSSAVLDNYITPRAGASYIPYTERGLTIYTYDGNAAWVNGGILYTIEGDAPLSSEQIRRIATSFM